jgi:hypothetical protein
MPERMLRGVGLNILVTEIGEKAGREKQKEEREKRTQE